LRISVSSCSPSSLLSVTTYFFTEISFPALTASIANSGDGNRQLAIGTAQEAFAKDWIAAYRNYEAH